MRILTIALMVAALAGCRTSGTAAEPLAGDRLLLTNLTIIDGTGAPPISGQSILIEGGSIVSIAPSFPASLKAGARVIDVEGGYVLPGLIDGHIHMTPWRDRDDKLQAMLLTGITTVRDMGGDARIIGDVAGRVADGTLAAPDVFYVATFFGPAFLQDRRSQVAASGIAPGEAPWFRKVTADTDLEAVVRSARESGASGIKLYSEIDPELMQRIVEEAHRQDIKVFSHASIFPSKPSDAVAAGVDTIVHNGMLFPESRDDLPADYHTGVREWMPTMDFSATPPDAAVFRELFAEMVRKGVIFEPTLAGSERFESNNGEGSHLATIDWEAMRAWGCAATGAAYEAGVTISAGTDTAGGAPVQREVELLVACGLSPLDAIAAATQNSARSIGVDASVGTIAVGKVADLLVLDQDPLERIENIRAVRLVIKNGNIVSPRAD